MEDDYEPLLSVGTFLRHRATSTMKDWPLCMVTEITSDLSYNLVSEKGKLLTFKCRIVDYWVSSKNGPITSEGITDQEKALFLLKLENVR